MSNDNAPSCTRWLYIDTLSRFVGPFLGFGVRNAANSNHLCPVEGCVWPKGSACTMSGCPGRSFKNCRAGAFPSPVPATAKGEGVIPTLSPTLSLDTHSFLHIAGDV